MASDSPNTDGVYKNDIIRSSSPSILKIDCKMIMQVDLPRCDAVDISRAP